MYKHAPECDLGLFGRWPATYGAYSDRFNGQNLSHSAYSFPVTGKPLLSNSLSITFHLPTAFSRSIGVNLLFNSCTFGRLVNLSSASRT